MARRWFGPSRDEVWRQLAEKIGGTFSEGTWRKSARVDASHGEWTVTLDSYAVSTGKVTIVYTRIRAPYVNPDGFRFTIYRRNVFSDVGKLFGMQDIEVGEEAFDRDYIIKSSDESKVRSLFSHPRLRELIRQQPDMHLAVRDDEGWFGPTFPDGVDMLSYTVAGIIKDVDRLKGLYDLFAETLDDLCRIGSAYESRPDVTL
jgi:hypothetical protein